MSSGKESEMERNIVKVCDWCREVISSDAPAVQTTSVDVTSVTGKDSRATVSTVRSYHAGDKDCYRRFLHQQHLRATAAGPVKTEPLSADAVSQDAYEWGEEFDMTAEESLSGTRRKFGGAHSARVLRNRRMAKG